jgi:biotin carboxylase
MAHNGSPFNRAESPIPDLRGQTLLVLGSVGFSKRGLYEAAARRGLQIALVKQEPATWEAGYCTSLLPLNCASYDEFDRVIPAVLDFARRHRVGGVVTTFDAAIPAAAEVASRLGLAGIPPAAAAALRDKSLMRRRFAELGLPSANSIPVRTPGEAASAAAEIGYPVIVKPRMGTGSAGVLLATSPDALRDFFATAQLAMQAANGRDELLIEEYLDGIEVCVDAVVANGELAFLNITDNPEVMNGPSFGGYEYVTPTSLSPGTAAEINAINRRVIEGFELANTVSHTEIRVTSRGPRLIEAHARPAGQRMPKIIQQACGIDLLGAAVEIAMNVRPDTDPRARGYACYRCVCPERAGILRVVDGIDAARAVPGVFDVELAIRPGTPVKTLPRDHQEDIAYVLTEGPSYEAARGSAQTAASLIHTEVA